MKQNKELIIASNNPNKIKEFQAMLNNFKISSLIDREIEIEENGETFFDNALIKAREIAKTFNQPALADDSGLVLKALDGRPGVYSKRYANTNNHDDNLYKVIEELKDKNDNTGYFIAVLCLYFPDDSYYFFEGRIDGEVIDEFKGKNGFGYDKIFYLPEYKKTMAELDESTKNQISHRKIALNKLRESGLIDKYFDSK